MAVRLLFVPGSSEFRSILVNLCRRSPVHLFHHKEIRIGYGDANVGTIIIELINLLDNIAEPKASDCGVL